MGGGHCSSDRKNPTLKPTKLDF